MSPPPEPRGAPAPVQADALPPLASAPALSAMLVVGGPALVAVLLSESSGSRRLALACGALTSLAGIALARGSRLSRPLATAGLALGLTAGRRVLAGAPDFALLFGVAAITLLGALWSAPRGRARSAWSVTLASASAVKSGAAAALAVWVALAINESAYPPGALAAAGASLALASAFLVAWVLRRLQLGAGAVLLPGGVWLLGAAVAFGLRSHPTWALTAWVVGLSAAVLFIQDDEDSGSAWGALLEHPARLIVATFAGLSALGALVLALPVSASSGHSLGLLDATFTAVSAACVTGLAVFDTGSTFSTFGQAVLLVLIQVGGLGMMSFYAVALRALGGRLGLRHELAVAEASLLDGQASLYRALGGVLWLTLVTELSGAAALTLLFRQQGLDWAAALWRGAFTAVSAFCNAGFALEATSLMAHQNRPLVLGVAGTLIMIGGLAPAVVLATPAWLRGRVVPLQVPLAWVTTLALTVLGFVGFLAFEWSHSLAALPWWHKLTNAAFQAISLRTAGFNSVDVSVSTPATQQIMMALMFIGGTPGGTAGGIKTTTFAVLILAVLTALRGRPHVTVLGKRIVAPTVYRAAAVATVGVLCVMGISLALMLTQPLPPEMVLFETVSALGTVGLSTGGTVLLDGVGKVVVAVAMFLGRVGPLTLFVLLGEQGARAPHKFPDAEVDVG